MTEWKPSPPEKILEDMIAMRKLVDEGMPLQELPDWMVLKIRVLPDGTFEEGIEALANYTPPIIHVEEKDLDGVIQEAQDVGCRYSVDDRAARCTECDDDTVFMYAGGGIWVCSQCYALREGSIFDEDDEEPEEQTD